MVITGIAITLSILAVAGLFYVGKQWIVLKKRLHKVNKLLVEVKTAQKELTTFKATLAENTEKLNTVMSQIKGYNLGTGTPSIYKARP